MPAPSLTFPMQLTEQTRKELEAMLAQLNEGFLLIEHHDDGTHGDIHADSITLIASVRGSLDSGGLVLYTEDGAEIRLKATNTGPKPSALFANANRVIDVRIDGVRAFMFGYLAANNVFGFGNGIFIQDKTYSLGSAEDMGFILSTGADTIATARGTLGILDTVERQVVFGVRPVGSPGFLTEYVIGPVPGTVIVPVSLGRESSGERWENVSAVNLRALTAVIIGGATTSGVLLKVSSGKLEVREGDDTAYEGMTLLSAAFSGRTSSDILLKKDSSQTLAVRLGDDSAYGSATVLTLLATTAVFLTGATSADIRLHKESSGVGAARLGDNSGYADWNCKQLSASNGVSATNFVSIPGIAPILDFYESDAAANNHYWRMQVDSTAFTFKALNDAQSPTATILTADRSGNVVVGANFYLVGVTSADLLFKKSASGTLSIRLGDDTAAAALVVGGVTATTVSGTTITASTGFSSADGSFGSNGFFFTGDTDTNMYRVSSGTIGFSLDNSGEVRFDKPGATTGTRVYALPKSFGTGAEGAEFRVGRNLSGHSAAGNIAYERITGTVNYTWHDTSGLMRTHTTAPFEAAGDASDTAGTVVGDQTSSADIKNILREREDTADCLDVILNTPVYDFTYKDGRYNGEQFTGITTDSSPIFGKDRGKAFNQITAFGYLVQAIKAQQEQIAALTQRVKDLEAKQA